MTCKVITVCNQKGGSGKTTIAMQLGGTLSLRGKKVLIIDGDEQNSAVEWAALAPTENPFPARVVNLWKAGKKIHQEIKKYIEDHDFIIIDCPPAAESPIAKSALIVSHLALVSFIPGALDMLAAVRIRETIEDAMILNQNLISLLVINRVELGTKLSQTVINMIPNFGMPVAKTMLHKRVHYGESVLMGCVVHALKKKAKDAVEEIEQLAGEVIDTMKISVFTENKVSEYENV
jgi:chromosome partitioning protein